MLKELTFDRDKPLYGVVFTFLCAMHGHMELISRQLAKVLPPLAERCLQHYGNLDSLISKLDGNVPQQRMPEIAKGRVTVLFEDLALHATTLGAPITPDVEKLAETSWEDFRRIIDNFTYQAAGSMLVVAWDTTFDLHSYSPEWEFLRHCRNAAAHRGKFNLERGEPKRAASWRGLQITPSLHGTDLFRRLQGGPMLLGPGDALLLLHDLEKTL